jgi:hypothetical protein
MAMAPKRESTSAECQQLLDENDALRAEIVKLKWKLENCEMIRQEQGTPALGRHRCRSAERSPPEPAEGQLWKFTKILREHIVEPGEDEFWGWGWPLFYWMLQGPAAASGSRSARPGSTRRVTGQLLKAR